MMNSNGASGAQVYDQIGTKSSVESASPHRLVQLMMERALTKIAMARGHIERNNISEKGAAIGSAISIVDGLRASLNHKTDKKISENFDALYDYMARRLVEANLHNDDGKLQEVAGLMREIKSAWDAIADHPDVREMS